MDPVKICQDARNVARDQGEDTLILDPAGRAVKTFLGPVTREDIEDYIKGTGTAD